jgi:chitin disaccharide deacetylase
MTYSLTELGFASDAKLLIINSDDFGMCQSGSAGTIKGLTEGFLTSASVLMPCPWANLALEFWQAHPEKSIGVELCLTSEWQVYRWGPISSRDKVPSLLDPEGYFWGNSRLVTQHAKLDEAERELRAQVERALGLGLDVTHLHNHMSSLIFREDLLGLYFKLCREYRLTGREMVRVPNADWAKLTQLIGSDLYYMAMADGKEP